jgi:hypothetical protein
VAILTGSSPFVRIPAGPSSSASIFTTPASAGKAAHLAGAVLRTGARVRLGTRRRAGGHR